MGSIVPAVKAFIARNGKVLLLHKKRSEESAYDLPGGRIRFSEINPEKALQREVKEETRLRIKITRPIAMTTILKNNRYQVVGTVFLCKARGRIKLSGEHEAYEWASLEKLKSKEYPGWIRKIADSFS